MGSAPAISQGLRAELVGPSAVWVGELARGALRVVNGGGAPHRVSGRLNFAEGDVRLLVTRPDGSAKRAFASRLVDSAARIVDLAPGGAIESGLILFHAHTGPLFDDPGTYEIVAQYDAMPGQPPLLTPALHVDARAPKTAEESELGRSMLEANVAVSFELGEPATIAARQALESIADRFAGRREGRAARLVVATAEGDRTTIADVIDDILTAEGPVDAARTVTALISPATPNGSIVREIVLGRLQRSRSKLVTVALAIVDMKPYYLDR